MTKNVDLTVKTPYMQQQKMLMYIFPVIFMVMGINFPVGVLVYWLTTNVWTMGQQMYVINQNPTPGSKAQDQYLQRLLKGITTHSEVRSSAGATSSRRSWPRAPTATTTSASSSTASRRAVLSHRPTAP